VERRKQAQTVRARGGGGQGRAGRGATVARMVAERMAAARIASWRPWWWRCQLPGGRGRRWEAMAWHGRLQGGVAAALISCGTVAWAVRCLRVAMVGGRKEGGGG